jgi:hypothetical protein
VQNLRKCKACEMIKELSTDNFQSSFDEKMNKIYFKKKCRECEKTICKNYHNKNRSNILNRKKAYDQKHYEERINKRKEYNQTVNAKIKNSKRALKRYYLNKNNPLYLLRRRVSQMVNKQLKKKSSSKFGESISKYINYSIQELKEHIEKQFDSNMSWQNYGIYWHIDHIIPQSDLPYISMSDENFQKCWSLSNLRPLEAYQNIIEGARKTRHKIV